MEVRLYEVEVGIADQIQMPKGAALLGVMGGSTLAIFAKVDPKAETEFRRFAVFRPGMSIPESGELEYAYIGSAPPAFPGASSLHVFEVLWRYNGQPCPF